MRIERIGHALAAPSDRMMLLDEVRLPIDLECPCTAF